MKTGNENKDHLLDNHSNSKPIDMADNYTHTQPNNDPGFQLDLQDPTTSFRNRNDNLLIKQEEDSEDHSSVDIFQPQNLDSHHDLPYLKSKESHKQDSEIANMSKISNKQSPSIASKPRDTEVLVSSPDRQNRRTAVVESPIDKRQKPVFTEFTEESPKADKRQESLDKQLAESLEKELQGEQEALLPQKTLSSIKIGSKQPEEKGFWSAIREYFHRPELMILLSILLLIILFVLLFLLFLKFSNSTKILATNKEILRPLADPIAYRTIRLPNRLQVFLMSDPLQKSSAASMSIGIGNLQDSLDFPGSIHLLEHMIPLGSQKFNRPMEFEDHLAKHFGSFNSFIDSEKTNFFFEIDSEGYEKALDMFANFFITPQLNEQSLTKQIELINEEFLKTRSNDGWREQQILKSLANPSHPFSKFNIGNNSTLNSTMKASYLQQVQILFDKFFIPRNMRLVLYAPLSLEEMQALAEKYFSIIKMSQTSMLQKKGYGEQVTVAPAFSHENLGRIVWFRKNPPGESLDIVFYCEEFISKAYSKPEDYVSYMLKYSGKGSLIAYLKQNRLAVSIDFGTIWKSNHFSLYGISMVLTDKGFREVKRVIEISFQYIEKVRQEHPREEIYQEIQKISETEFFFSQKPTNLNDHIAATNLNMFDYSHKDYLFASQIHWKFEKEEIKNIMSSLMPENSLIVLGSDKYPQHLKDLLDTNTTEPIYSTEYSHKKLPVSFPALLTPSDLALKDDYIRENPLGVRAVNALISNETKLSSCLANSSQISCETELKAYAPELIVNENNLKVWFRLDRTFKAPRVDSYIYIVSDALRASSEDYAVFSLYQNYLKYLIEMELSDAEDAGNSIHLSLDENGIVIRMRSYSDLMIKLYSKLSDMIFSRGFKTSEFKIIKEMALIDIETLESSSPYTKADLIFKKLTKAEKITIYSNLKPIIQKMNFEAFKAKMKEIQNTLALHILVYGVINRQEIQKIQSLYSPLVSNSRSKLSEDNNLLEYLHATKKITGKFLYYTINDNPRENSNLLTVYYQIGQEQSNSFVLAKLTELAWGNTFNYQLKELKKVGLEASVKLRTYDDVMYYKVSILSKLDLRQVQVVLNSIVEKVKDKIEFIEDDKFEKLRKEVMNQITEPYVNLQDKSKLAWTEIYEGELNFKNSDEVVENLKVATKRDIYKFFSEVFVYNLNRLTIAIDSQNAVDEANALEDYPKKSSFLTSQEENENLIENLQEKFTTRFIDKERAK